MNVFKSLDCLFPTGKNRLFGEVVSCTFQFHLDGPAYGETQKLGYLTWKRKAWYVDASVNAFHMHRGLVREFCDQMAHKVPVKHHKAVKRLMVLAILNSYLANCQEGTQYSCYNIDIPLPGYFSELPACWWVSSENHSDWREICDNRELSLVKQVWQYVDHMLLSKQSGSDAAMND